MVLWRVEYGWRWPKIASKLWRILLLHGKPIVGIKKIDTTSVLQHFLQPDVKVYSEK